MAHETKWEKTTGIHYNWHIMLVVVVTAAAVAVTIIIRHLGPVAHT